MISQRLANMIFAVIFMVAVIWLAWMAWGFKTNSWVGSATLPTKFFPLLLLGFVAVSIVIYFIEYLVKGESGSDRDDTFFDTIGGFVRTALTIVIVLGCYWIWRQKSFVLPFGEVPAFAIAGMLMPVATAFVMGNRKPLQMVVIAVVSIAVFLAFHYGLGTRFGG